MTRVRLALCLVSLLVSGCGGSLATAVDAYDQGRLAEAAGRLRALEPRYPELSAAAQLRYALYRGLTLLALGDAARAEAWLAFVKRATDADPRRLTPAERGRWSAAWRSLGHMPGDTLAARE